MKLTRRSVLFGALSQVFASGRKSVVLIESGLLPSQGAQQRIVPRGQPRDLSFNETGGSGVVDSHAHIWPLRAQANPSSFTVDDFLRVARAEGVDRAVLIQPAYARFDNRYILEAIKNHPALFRDVGLVDHRSRNALREMQRLAAGGVRGFRIPLPVWGTECLRSPAMRRLWESAADSGLLMCLLLDPDALPSLREMCRLYPQTTVVIDHLARIGLDGKIRQSDVDALCALAVLPRTYVKLSAFYALGRKRAPYLDLEVMIRQVFSAFGARRLMWGSDAPFQLLNDRRGYADSLGLIRRLQFVSAEDRKWLLTKTATALFFQYPLPISRGVARD